jgi:hypothetical protein
VKCRVYRVRQNGARKSTIAAPVAGDLVLLTWQDGSNRRHRLRAELHSPQGLSLLPVLDHATVIKITGRGIVITGLELLPSGRKGPIDRYKQTWWCEMAGG